MAYAHPMKYGEYTGWGTFLIVRTNEYLKTLDETTLFLTDSYGITHETFKPSYRKGYQTALKVGKVSVHIPTDELIRLAEEAKEDMRRQENGWCPMRRQENGPTVKYDSGACDNCLDAERTPSRKNG